MRRLSLLSALCLLFTLAFSSASAAQDDLNCDDFATQEDAQAEFDADPSDPNGLDGPPGEGFTGIEGVACEELPSGDGGQRGGGANGDLMDAGGDLPLPDTGGAVLLLPACVMLVAGLVGLAVSR